MVNKVTIDNRVIGPQAPCLIVAEIGCNHNGDLKLAKELIAAAVASGVDAVKFQKFVTSELLVQSAPNYALLKKLELSEEDFHELFDYAGQKKTLFLATPFDTGSMEFLFELGVPAYKISSGDANNLPLLKQVAEKGLPILLSTGMSALEEIEEAVNTIKDTGNEDIVLLHCTSCYPTLPENCNLRAISTLAQGFSLPIGFSDHSCGIILPIAAVALGACVVEKHFTLDRNLPGPDQAMSLVPEELKELVRDIRLVEKALGCGLKKPFECEQAAILSSRKSIVAATVIPKGTIITPQMLSIKRTGTNAGLAPKFLKEIVGKRAKQDIAPDEAIGWKKLGESPLT